MKPKGVTTQMKALDESFLMVVFTSLLNTVHVFANLKYKSNKKNMTVKSKKIILKLYSLKVDSYYNIHIGHPHGKCIQLKYIHEDTRF